MHGGLMMKKMFSLEDRVAIVTGGNRGIGKGIARAFAEAGANIVIGDIAIGARNGPGATNTVDEIKTDFGVEALGLKVDVRLEKDNQDMVKKALDAFGRIDILVCNAGMGGGGIWPQDMEVAKWDEIMETNLRSYFIAAREVYPIMKKGGGGKIIGIGSVTSLFGVGPFAVYGASKGGVLQLTRGLAVGWAADNIQVNCILPGWINTDLSVNAKKKDPGLEKRVTARTPAGRWGETADIAGTALFLASRASDFVTGVAIPVDGGYSVQG